MQRRKQGVLFTVLISVALFIGACLMAVLLVASGAPKAMGFGLVLASLPVGPLVACYLWLDRYEPEPRSLLLLALGWGAFVATTVALIFQAVDQFAFHHPETFVGTVVAPLTEEAAKGLFIVLLLLYRRNEFDGILDGIVYAGMIGIGFAFTENILYLGSAYMGVDGNEGGIPGAIAVFVIRGVFSPFAHPLFTAFTGIGAGIAVGSRSRTVRFLAPLVGYLMAVSAHAAWNSSAFFNGGRGFILTYLFLMVPAFFVLSGFAIWSRRREGQVLTRALADCAQRGLIDAAEIPWLVRLPARKAARRNARAVGGATAKEAMAEYQQEAIELGFLHHRFLRGTAPKDFSDRGRDHLETMASLRPGLVWPRHADRTAFTVSTDPSGGGR